MQKLSREDLMPLEKYAENRKEFRARVLEHKKNRQVQLGANVMLYFEDSLTVQYQVQEMLRIEKIFEAAAIQEELEAYTPLIPDGKNWKATFMVEYPDVDERKTMLARLIGIERKVWVRIDDCEKVYPIANEDLERETEEKTSAVHFLRFEFTPEMVASAKLGTSIAIGVEHENYTEEVNPLPDNIRNALVKDFA